jgi:hypothetical protein
MKINTILLVLIICVVKSASAQIISLPHTEGFESPFVQGVDVEFAPAFTGNEVASTNRIFQDAANHYSGAASCAIVPTSSYDGQIVIRLNMSTYSNLFMDFKACSGINGSGTRPALVEISTSIDNGLNYGPSVSIGDSATFPNSNTAWNNYHYVLPYSSYNQSAVAVRIKITRGDGTGTTAKLLLDDVTFDFTPNDITPPYILDAWAGSQNQVKIAFSEPVDSTADNVSYYSGISGMGNASHSALGDTITINLINNLTIGHWYMMSVSSIKDVAGNPMAALQQFIITYNNNSGNVKITEINYNNPGADSLSFVELKNMDNVAIQVGGWKFTKGMNGYFPSDYILQPGAYLVFAQNISAVNSFYNIGSYFMTGSLSNNGENIAIYNSDEQLIDSVRYGSASPWDSLANGFGPSLVLCNESDDNDQPANWTAAITFAGIVSLADTIWANPMSNCSMINQVNELKTVNNLVTYPNPVNDLMFVQYYSDRHEDEILVITDLYGKVVKRELIQVYQGQNNIQVNIPDMNNGLYNLTLGNLSSRFLKR